MFFWGKLPYFLLWNVTCTIIMIVIIVTKLDIKIFRNLQMKKRIEEKISILKTEGSLTQTFHPKETSTSPCRHNGSGLGPRFFFQSGLGGSKLCNKTFFAVPPSLRLR